MTAIQPVLELQMFMIMDHRLMHVSPLKYQNGNTMDLFHSSFSGFSSCILRF